MNQQSIGGGLSNTTVAAIVNSPAARALGGMTAITSDGEVVSTPETFLVREEDRPWLHARMIIDNYEAHPGRDGEVRWPVEEWNDAVEVLALLVDITIGDDEVTFKTGEAVRRTNPED